MPSLTASDWARICRIEAMRARHPPTKAFLLELLAEYQALEPDAAVEISPDDSELQQAVADRLCAAALEGGWRPKS